MPSVPNPFHGAATSARRILLLALLVLPAAADAQQQPVPSPSRTELFTWTDAAIFGGFALATVAVAPLDREIAESLQRSNFQENRLLGDLSTVVRNVAAPGSAIIGVGLYTVGRLTRNDRAADLGLHGTEAVLIATGVGTLIKGTLGRARPYRDASRPKDFKLGRGWRDSGDYRSFPSGHTIAAFAAAAAVTTETDRWWPQGTWAVGSLMYGGAALAGASRMYNNRHWASDVLVGAAIGTFAGLKVTRWHHSHPGNRIDRFFLGGTISPSASGGSELRLMAMPVVGGR
ncbi:MAG TPA: phosphatase PAP2 family protein [Gemmatimonadaceae bacterium]|nr:phosphatase PAP2 family protein [Gemmatimonadaceae bacterium]